MTAGAVAIAFAFGACGDEASRKTAPTGPRFAAGGALTVNLDQCANDPRTANCSWQNGDLNGNNSVYAEGLAIPFRLEIKGLRAGTHTIHVNYDFTAGGHEGYDFLADFDATEKVDLCATGGGGRSGLCDVIAGGLTKATASDFEVFPSDGFAVPGANNLLVSGAEASAVFGVNAKRRLYAWGAQIVSITPADPTHAGPTTGNSTADFLVTFTNTTSTEVAFAWSGHLAQSSYWKNSDASADGAGEISGAPWHMRTQQLDGSGNKNQDRSIQPSALVQEPVLAITKTPATQTVDAGQSFSWTITLTNGGPGTATGAAFTDNLPSITGVTYALDAANSDATCSLTGNALECGPKDLAEGATLAAKINATTTAGQGCSTTAYTNTATGTAGNAESVSASATVTIQCPSLSITKTPDTSADAGYALSPGDSAKFTITVSNAGPGSAYNVVMTDTLPAGLTWVESPDKTECTFDLVTVSSVSHQRIICNIGTLASSASFSVRVAAEIPSTFLVQTPTPGGSSVEIDGNLVDDGAGDWATPPTNLDNKTLSCTANPKVGCALDLPTGSSDNSFGQGTKEDTPVPTVVTGSIPNNKSDLTRFYVTNNRKTVGTAVHDILYLAWERVQEPNGTTNMDFEFNQSSTLSSNNTTPVRTAGDILVKYDLSQGGGSLSIGYHTWVTSGTPSVVCEASNSVPCWGKLVDLTATGAVQGAANHVQVVDPLNPNAPRTLSVLTFGEASVDLQAAGIFSQSVCKHFGGAYLKSRSSDSFTSELKDFISPIPVNITNCAPRRIDNLAWAIASGVTAISDSGHILVSESSSAALFTEPGNLRLAQVDLGSTLAASAAAVAAESIEATGRRMLSRRPASIVRARDVERAFRGLPAAAGRLAPWSRRTIV